MGLVYRVVNCSRPSEPGATPYVRRSVKWPRICGVVWTVLTFQKTGRRRFDVCVWVRRWQVSVAFSGGVR